MKVKELLTEGTWSLPGTPDKVMILKNAFGSPLTPEGAEELYHVLGDDDMMDIVSSLRKEHGKNVDVRRHVAHRVLELLDTSTWIKQPDEHTAFYIKMLKKLLLRFTESV